MKVGATTAWAGLLLCSLTACILGGSAREPLGTLVYTTPNTLPPPWTATGAAATPTSDSQVYQGIDVELWLPAGFVGGDPAARLGELLEAARAAGPGFEEIVQAIEEQPESLLFCSWELEQYEMIVTVSVHEAPAEMSVEAYLGQWVQSMLQQQPAYDEVSKGPVQIDGEMVGRAVLDLTREGTVTRQISYLVKSGATVWVLAYLFPADRYIDLVPVVERSVQTFRAGAE